MALDFLAGCVGGCAGVLVGHPFDTIKVHLQTQDFKNPKYRGTFDCFQTILRNESMWGLYRGMSSPMAGVAVINAIIFGVYGNTQRCMANPDSLQSQFVAGCVAGFSQSFVCSPMELAKTRIQVQQGATYKSPLHCLMQVSRTEGMRGVFRGLGLTMARDVVGVGAYFAAYEWMTHSDTPISTPHMLLAGGLAGSFSWVLSYPADVLKSRIQIDGMNGGAQRYSGAADCFRQSLRAEGYSFLARGLNSTLLRAFPMNATTFAVVTWVFRLVGVPQEDNSGYHLASEFLKIPSEVKIEHRIKEELLGIRVAAVWENRENIITLLHWRKLMMHNITGNFYPASEQSGFFSETSDVETHKKITNQANVEQDTQRKSDIVEKFLENTSQLQEENHTVEDRKSATGTSVVNSLQVTSQLFTTEEDEDILEAEKEEPKTIICDTNGNVR